MDSLWASNDTIQPEISCSIDINQVCPTRAPTQIVCQKNGGKKKKSIRHRCRLYEEVPLQRIRNKKVDMSDVGHDGGLEEAAADRNVLARRQTDSWQYSTFFSFHLVSATLTVQSLCDSKFDKEMTFFPSTYFMTVIFECRIGIISMFVIHYRHGMQSRCYQIYQDIFIDVTQYSIKETQLPLSRGVAWVIEVPFKWSDQPF